MVRESRVYGNGIETKEKRDQIMAKMDSARKPDNK
jgi:hypothetical protein